MYMTDVYIKHVRGYHQSVESLVSELWYLPKVSACRPHDWRQQCYVLPIQPASAAVQ